jgi:hypothetical protein
MHVKRLLYIADIVVSTSCVDVRLVQRRVDLSVAYL